VKVMAEITPTLDDEAAYQLNLLEISEWFDWMRRELPAGGVDLPSEETSVLFAARAVRLAERIRTICPRGSTHLRSLGIQASILHQCWAQQRNLRESGLDKVRHLKELRITTGTKFLERLDGCRSIEASDGNRYTVRFPKSDYDTELATEVIGIELARLIGLPVPSISLVVVDKKLAEKVGIGTAGWPRYVSTGSVFCCLGLQVVENVNFDMVGHEPPLTREGSSQLIGGLILDILLLNWMGEPPLFRTFKKHSEPIFLYRSRCMMNANWPRFLKASYREFPAISLSAMQEVRSMEQLKPWIRNLRNADLGHLWKLVFELPPCWYGSHRIAVTGVLRKLDTRIFKLRDSIDYLVGRGCFPNMQSQEGETAENEAIAS
jgi:hypothetical protein